MKFKSTNSDSYFTVLSITSGVYVPIPPVSGTYLVSQANVLTSDFGLTVSMGTFALMCEHTALVKIVCFIDFLSFFAHTDRVDVCVSSSMINGDWYCCCIVFPKLFGHSKIDSVHSKIIAFLMGCSLTMLNTFCK